MSEGGYPQVEEPVRGSMAGCRDASSVIVSPVFWRYHTPSLWIEALVLSVCLHCHNCGRAVSQSYSNRCSQTWRNTAKHYFAVFVCPPFGNVWQ